MRARGLILVALTLGCAEEAAVDAFDDVEDLDAIEWIDATEKPEDLAPALDTGPVTDTAPVPDNPAVMDAAAVTDAAPVMDARPVVDAAPPRDVGVDAGTRADVPVDPGYPFPTPIRHIVVLVRENRTFDHLYQGFPGAETRSWALRSDGVHYTLRRAPDGDLPGDIRHNHNGAVMAYHGGRMDGFDRNAQMYSDTGNRNGPFLHYTEAQIPNYWRYARRFTLCDHFFSTNLAGSSPGHFTFWTAQSPLINNPECPGTSCDDGSGCFARGATVDVINQDTCAARTRPVAPCFDVPSIVDAFPGALTWRVYANPSARGFVSSPLAMVRGPTRDRAAFAAHTGRQSDLVADLRAGRQANLIIAHVGGAAGEHPPAGLCRGENFAVEVVNAVMQGPHWRDTAVLLTYDDWGGFYDHVAPPQERCSSGDHVRLGFRLPMVVVSPYARRGADLAHPYVFHGVADQASVPRLIEDLLRLPRLHARDAHARDARAGSLIGAFDFAHPDFAPMVLTPRACP
jgi:phospholipase C